MRGPAVLQVKLCVPRYNLFSYKNEGLSISTLTGDRPVVHLNTLRSVPPDCSNTWPACLHLPGFLILLGLVFPSVAEPGLDPDGRTSGTQRSWRIGGVFDPRGPKGA